MLTTHHAVGIDLGTTYSCIAYLNEQGEPVSIPNQEGEICTPSVVMYEGDEEVVGTEALRNAIINPGHVVQNAKRWMGDPHKTWNIEGRTLTPVDVAAAVLRKLLGDAQRQIGTIERAVITVPAQFSDIQRQCTLEAGMKAGLKQVDIINEPVAASLCYVLGTEGLWFTELANEQRILVYDLGGGTFDLSLVSYQKNEVRVIASSGDLHLGGIDWNQALIDAAAEQFKKEFNADPRQDPESLQHLSLEAEQCKRSLTVRPRAALICQHGGQRKTFQIELERFNQLTRPLVQRTEDLTVKLLKDNKMGWARVDVVLSTGGSSRMPMIRDTLKRLSGRTINTSLSPDQSIAHGATYYAGMLLSKSEFVHAIWNSAVSEKLSKLKQHSVNARGLGILTRDEAGKQRIPFYLIPANTTLPASVTKIFGTVVPNQRRVNLHIIESGTTSDQAYVELGACVIEGLPPNLPVESEIAVTISYDHSARVHVAARDVTSGRQAAVEIVRRENLIQPGARGEEESGVMLPPGNDDEEEEIVLIPADAPRRVEAAPHKGEAAPPVGIRTPPASAPPQAKTPAAATPHVRPAQPARAAAPRLEDSVVPVPLCDHCGGALTSRGECPYCHKPAKADASPAPPAAEKRPVSPTSSAGPAKSGATARPQPSPPRAATPSVKPVPPNPGAARPAAAGPAPKPVPRPAGASGQQPALPQKPRESVALPAPKDEEIVELPPLRPGSPRPRRPLSSPPPAAAEGEEEFWKLAEE